MIVAHSGEGCSEEALIELILERGIREIVPSRSYEAGPNFYDALGLSEEYCPNLSEVLESLSEKELLKKSKIGTVPSCPNCGSFKLIVKLSCPVCGSTNIRRTDAITHLACSFTAPAESFEAMGTLKCPKCGKQLRAIGVDYNRLSGVVVCDDCKNVSLSPKLEFECADCGAEVSERELVLKPIYKYEVLREKLLAKRPAAGEIARILRERGFDVRSPREALGLSGILHKFSMSLSFNMSDREKVIDVVQSEAPVSEEKVLALFGKMVDTQIEAATLVAMPRATEGAKALAKNFNITVLEASTPEEAAEAIEELMKGRKMMKKVIDEET